MSSRSSSSCLGSVILILIALIMIRFGLPRLWSLIAVIFSTAFYGGLVIFLLLCLGLGFLIYRNFQANKKPRASAQKDHRVTRVQELYSMLVNRLERESLLNEISAEEFLQSEVLVSQTLRDLQNELNRLRDVASPQNVQSLNQQVYEYKKELQATPDGSVKEVIEENLKLLEDRKTRMAQAAEDIRQKEASLDLVYHSLLRTEEELNLGKPIRRLLPAEIYQRFGLTPPKEKDPLRPLIEKSSGTE